jgi:tRNA pseudouridine32 synthase / 23S rRNA pseudouridine746 synthase
VTLRAPLPTKDGVGPSVITLPNETGAWNTILDFLVTRFTYLSRDEIAQRIEAGAVCDEYGAPILPSTKYQPQQKLYYYRAIENEALVPFQETILFEDEWIVVADKPHFLAVTPGGRFLQETLLIRLKRKLGSDTLTPMHRIDRETAGLVLFCKVPAVRGQYQTLFQYQQVQKTYLAVACHNDKLVMPLTYRSCIKQSQHFMQMEEVAGEPNSEVHIDCLRQNTQNNTQNALYQLTPKTGKKHQLRVQMAALGLPILNDKIYPIHISAADENTAEPLQLLAHTLVFTDPVTGRAREFMSQRSLALAPI